MKSKIKDTKLKKENSMLKTALVKQIDRENTNLIAIEILKIQLKNEENTILKLKERNKDLLHLAITLGVFDLLLMIMSVLISR